VGRTERLDPVQLVEAGAEGLVGDDVRPVLQRRDGPRAPDGEVITHRHDVRTHLLQHRLVVAVGEVVLRGELLARGLVLLAHAHDLQVIGVLRGLAEPGASARATERRRRAGGIAEGAKVMLSRRQQWPAGGRGANCYRYSIVASGICDLADLATTSSGQH